MGKTEQNADQTSNETLSLQFPTTYTEDLEDASSFYTAAFKDISTAKLNSEGLLSCLNDYSLYDNSEVRTIAPDLTDTFNRIKNNLCPDLSDLNDSMMGDIGIFSAVSASFIDVIAQVQDILSNMDKDSQAYRDLQDALLNGHSIEDIFSEDTSRGDTLKAFFSKEDLLRRTKLTSTNVEDLSRMGVLDDLNETDQLSLFDF
jgi:hypothetical protein